MSRSTPVGFPLVATLLLPSENSPSLSADQVETRLRERIPGVVVDREQGDTYVAAKLKRLIELGTPEILLSGERSLTGRTLYVTFPVEGYPGVILSGYTFGFSDYDGCISLSCEPFDREALQAGTLGFAERMGLTVSLGFGDTSEISLELWPGVLSFEECLARQLPYFTANEFQRLPVADWRATIATACQNWIERHPEPRIPSAWVEKRGAPAVSIPQLIERLQSIGTVQGCWSVARSIGYFDCVFLQYPDWTGLLMLPGVPATVLG